MSARDGAVVGTVVIVAALVGWMAGTRHTNAIDWAILLGAVVAVIGAVLVLSSRVRFDALGRRHRANDVRGREDLSRLSSTQALLLRGVALIVAGILGTLIFSISFALKGHPFGSAAVAAGIVLSAALLTSICSGYDRDRLAVTALVPPRIHPKTGFREAWTAAQLRQQTDAAMLDANQMGESGRPARELLLLAEHPGAYWPKLDRAEGRDLRRQMRAKASFLVSFLPAAAVSAFLALFLTMGHPFPFWPQMPGPRAMIEQAQTAVETMTRQNDASENEPASSPAGNGANDSRTRDEGQGSGTGDSGGEGSAEGAGGQASGQQGTVAPGAGAGDPGGEGSAESAGGQASGQPGTEARGAGAGDPGVEGSAESAGGQAGDQPGNDEPGSGGESQSGKGGPGEGSGNPGGQENVQNGDAQTGQNASPSQTSDMEGQDIESASQQNGQGSSDRPAPDDRNADARNGADDTGSAGTDRGAAPRQETALDDGAVTSGMGLDQAATAADDETTSDVPNAADGVGTESDRPPPDTTEVEGIFTLNTEAEDQQGVDVEHDTQISLASPGGLAETIEATPMTGATDADELRDIDLPAARQKVPGWIADLIKNKSEENQ